MYSYDLFENSMEDELMDFMTGSRWPFHGEEEPVAEDIRKRIEEDVYTSEGNLTYWITAESGEKVGLIRVFDLDDPICLFDIRIKENWRGRGAGRAAVEWLTDRLFRDFPELIRIEGHTRSDNVAMRRTFATGGYVKEMYTRQSWPQGGKLYDAVGYAVIRADWENGTVTKVEDELEY
ncbi:GNAT family N-acetyltransferase [Alteribacter natronophilus]|uniref:GNAT family N-acetyltransferase n=1 Tax=Alteribacter natronophilus TaxID=2583810 RepID=UPI00110E2F92|nr:GNAT family protein [Alteribacter natronophilus]TMW72798.1 GNAT family N-acetyltransferase [Alteribacter natronophilus]